MQLFFVSLDAAEKTANSDSGNQHLQQSSGMQASDAPAQHSSTQGQITFTQAVTYCVLLTDAADTIVMKQQIISQRLSRNYLSALFQHNTEN